MKESLSCQLNHVSVQINSQITLDAGSCILDSVVNFLFMLAVVDRPCKGTDWEKFSMFLASCVCMVLLGLTILLGLFSKLNLLLMFFTEFLAQFLLANNFIEGLTFEKLATGYAFQEG